MKAKNVVIVVVLLAAAWVLSGYAPVFQAQKPGSTGNSPDLGEALKGSTFAEGSQQVLKAWNDAGVPFKGYVFDTSLAETTSIGNLSKAVNRLSTLEGGFAAPELKEFAGVHANLARHLLAWKRFVEKVNVITTASAGGDFCGSLKEIRARDQALAEAVAALKAYQNGHNGFRTEYPADAVAAGMNEELTINTDELEADLAMKQASTAALERTC